MTPSPLAKTDAEVSTPTGNLDASTTGNGVMDIGNVEEEEKSDGQENEGSSKDQQVNALLEAHRQKDAELDNYLESLKPKPKRKSIKEMLMSMPGYKDIAAITPKIGGGKKEDVIIFEADVCKKKSAKQQKKQSEIEKLKDRFVRHCTAGKPTSTKGDHVTLKIQKKEEDSQGIEHVVENKLDYIRNPLNEEEEAVSFLSPQVISPLAPPGDKRRRLKVALMEKIRAQKLKDHEERVKEYKMYNDENYGGEGDKSDEEIIDDEEEVESGSEEDEEQEEGLESLLGGSSRKKEKCDFVDDEAEDEDGDDEDDESSDSSDDDHEDKVPASPEGSVHSGKDIDSEPSTPVKETCSEDSVKCVDFGPDITPKITTAVLNQRTPSDFWIPAKSGLTCSQMDELSPLIPRIDKSHTNQESEQFRTFPAVPESLASVISEPKAGFGDLVDMCSGRFVSQINPTDLTESQEVDEFGGFDFGDDEDLTENHSSPKSNIKTTEADTSRTAVDGLTPKLSEKAPKTRLFMQFDEVTEKAVAESDKNKIYDPINSQNNLDDDDEDEVIGIKIKGRKQKRLQFSDDEDDGPEENLNNSHSSDENAEELELESEGEANEASQEIKQVEAPINPFFNKHGKLKRKFVDDEAELSGSEDGSDDEDEKGLNHYEEMEGDADEIDEDDLKNQVEKAYLKRMHDDDDLAIRQLQNKYLENGEFHSDQQRLEKKFSWKMNMEDLNDDAVFGNSDNEDVEENPDEAKEKKEWIERRKWMSENSHLFEANEDDTQSLLNSSKFVKISKKTIQKLESLADTSTSESSNVIIKETSVQRRSIYEEILTTKSAKSKQSTSITSFSEGLNLDATTTSTVKLDKSVSQPLFCDSESSKSSSGFKRGSYLNRGGIMLQKLAEATKQSDQVSNVKNNSRNFVFQTITPPNVEKSNGSTSRVKRGLNAGSNQAATKKVKIDRSFNNLDESSKSSSIFKYL